MASLVDLPGTQYGIETAETSLEVQSFTVTVAPEYKTQFNSRLGSKKGFAVGDPETKISIEGYITAATGGFWDFTFATACTIANDKTYWGGLATGDVFLDSGTITQAESDLKRVSMELSSNLGITVA